jgi:hypothetical protein
LELTSFTAEIREICEKRSEAKAELGEEAALELARVLADIEAFDNFADFAATFANQIVDRGEFEKCFQMQNDYSLIFRAGHPRNLGARAAPPDWGTTTRIMITAIEKADD